MPSVPNSYKDPYWSNLASAAEQKVGLPSGMLKSIVMNGERSNADQVSEAGAKTPFQIIPATRDLVVKKYGIDPYLSPENAAEASALLLKEGLDRNKGNIAQAIGEYHGGTDRSNWGPRTRAYIARTVAGINQSKQQTPQYPVGQSTFDKVSAQMASSQQDQNAIASVYDAYKSGKMSPEDAKAFEDDVNSGLVMLPRGASLSTAGAQGTTQALELPQAVTEAYVSGQMSPDEKSALEDDIKAGVVKLPPSIGSLIPGNSPDWHRPTEQAIAKPVAQESVIDKIKGAGEAALALGTGMTTGAFGQLAGTVEGVAKSIVDGTYGTQQGVQNAADLAAKRSSQLTYQPTSSAGQEYSSAIGDVMQNAMALGPEVASLGQIGRAAAQDMSAAKAIASPQISKAVDSAKNFRSSPEAVSAPEPVPQTPISSASDVAQAAKAASEGGPGSGKALRTLAEQAAPDAKTVEAAQRLGVAEYLQPDHVTTSQAYREVAQAVKSIPGSESRAAELQGLAQVAKKADDLVSTLGGTDDLSTLSAGIKSEITSTHDALKASAGKIYGEIANSLEKQAVPAPAPNVINFVKERAKTLGGEDYLSAGEKMILKNLSPKDGVEPTYALLDQTRKQIGAAKRGAQSAFADADTKLLGDLESALRQDQKNVADAHGLGDKWEVAQGLTRSYKGMQDDLTALFGKNLDGSIVSKLTGAVKSLPSGDVSKFVNLLKSVPESMRKETVASGLATAFGQSAKRGEINFNSYAQWYEGLLKNKKAHAALMSNLPAEARKSLSDLYRVSKGISLASKERIQTGRINAIIDEIKGADGMVGTLYNMAKKAATVASIEAAGSAVGIPGAGVGTAIAMALSKRKTPAIKAADALMSSPEFLDAVKEMSKGNKKAAIAKLSKSKSFDKFFKEIKKNNATTDKSEVINSVLEGGSSSAANKSNQE